MKEKAYLVENLRDLKRLPKDTDRIYLGSEYCLKAFPKQFKDLLNRAIKLEIPFSLLTPPIIESELHLLFNIIELFEKTATIYSEVIINDWGLLHFIHKNKRSKYKIRIGRFLSYQKRGTQKLYESVKESELSSVPIFDKKTIDFFINMNIEGIDIDIPIYNVNTRFTPSIDVAVYLPYALNSYTINCPFTFNGTNWCRICKRECLDLKFIYKNEEIIESFFQKGKAYYTKSGNIIPLYVKRIVILEW